MITDKDMTIEAFSQYPVKMVIEVRRIPQHQHSDGVTHEGQWAVLVLPRDGDRPLPKVEAWMVAAVQAAVMKLESMQLQMTATLIGQEAEASVQRMDLMNRVQENLKSTGDALPMPSETGDGKKGN